MECEETKKLKGKEKKAETIRQNQKAKKKKLLEILEESSNIGAALARVGIDRSTYSRWRANDQKFSLDASNAIAEGIERTADNVELSLLNGARNGDVRAQKYYLDHNHERYKRSEDRVPDNPLTEKRKAEIANCMMAWSRPAYPADSDERRDDYESGYDGHEDDDERDEDYELKRDDTDSQDE